MVLRVIGEGISGFTVGSVINFNLNNLNVKFNKFSFFISEITKFTEATLRETQV